MRNLLLFYLHRIPIRFLIGLVILFLPAFGYTQVKVVTGIVVDQSGQPLPGVSVTVKNTENGTATDEAGKFSLAVPENAVLVFSAVNFDPLEQQVNESNALRIVLKAAAGSLSDVVVVGYATQKKANLTGSVSMISKKSLETRPVTNVSSALSGLAAGVYVRQGSGKPDNDDASIRIRGIGSPNNASALVVIDGIPGTMDAVNPADIESISILKDASAASIYGATAANGVILITTKKGSRGKPSVTYTGTFSDTRPVQLPSFVSDYATHMEYYNEARYNLGQGNLYPQAAIDLWREKKAAPHELNSFGIPNYVAYANTDWGKEIFDYGLLQNHNISVAGGSENTRYLFSGRYLDNPGIMHNTGIKRYELRMNLETAITKFLTVGTQTFGLSQKGQAGNTDNTGLFNFLRQTAPGLYPFYEGRFGAPSETAVTGESQSLNNLLVHLYGNAGEDLTNRLNTTVFARVKFLKDFEFETKYNYQLRTLERNRHVVPIDRWDFSANSIIVQATQPAQMGISAEFNKNYVSTFDNVLRWKKSIGQHAINALVGHNEWYYNENGFGVSQTGVIDGTIYTIGTGTITNTPTGYENDRGMRSFFGRVNYVYDNRYLFEANLRRDASSKFGEYYRWGSFPSFSFGWRISEEAFYKNFEHVVQNLKVRASWGRLGNELSLGNYDKQSSYGAANYSFGGSPYIALARTRLGNDSLRWEEATNTSIALEGNLLNNKLSFEIEYFNRATNKILTTLVLPSTMGRVSSPFVNGPSFINKGWEVNLGYRNSAGAFSYDIKGNFSYIKNKVSKWKGELRQGWEKNSSGEDVWRTNFSNVADLSGANGVILENHLFQEYFVRSVYRGSGQYFNTDGSVNPAGGPRTGMIRTPEDMAWVNAMKAAGYTFSPQNTTYDPATPGSNKGLLNYGDLIYDDLNGDKVYGNSNDRYFTGSSPNPKFIFGFSTYFSWKGIDLGLIWFGAAGMQYYWDQEGYNNSRLQVGNAVSTRVAANRYFYDDANPDNPRNNTNGTLPRLKVGSDAINYQPSDYWLYNAGFLKLRNIQLGYTVPKHLSDKISATSIRLFASAENLLTISSFEGLDPEMGPNIGYPIMKQFAGGIVVGF